MVSSSQANKLTETESTHTCAKLRAHTNAHDHTSAMHRHTYIHNKIHTLRGKGMKKTQGWDRIYVFPKVFITSSKPFIPLRLHSISCSGLNLAAKWRVPLCSNTGVCAASEGLDHHCFTATQCKRSYAMSLQYVQYVTVIITIIIHFMQKIQHKVLNIKSNDKKMLWNNKNKVKK